MITCPKTNLTLVYQKPPLWDENVKAHNTVMCLYNKGLILKMYKEFLQVSEGQIWIGIY